MEKKQIQNIKNLLDKVSAISKKYEEIAKITGENFNIFKVMNVQSDEVRLHSAFITELLNPKGSHGQGDVFLELFVKQFSIKDFDSKNATTEKEKYIGRKTETEGGFIDIVISSGNRNIFIENKIYAEDQPQQLLRYHNEDKKAVLLYLTLYGKEASDESTGISEEEETGKDYYIPISYDTDIIYWLQECKKEAVNLPILRETITQYINIIKHLTGRAMNQKEMFEKYEIFKKNIKAYENILKTDKELSRYISNKVTDAFNSFGLKTNSTNLISKHFVFEKQTKLCSCKEHKCCEKFRLWVNLEKMKFDDVFEVVFELYDKENTRHGEKLKNKLKRKYGKLSIKEDGEGVEFGTKGSIESDYYQIYYIKIKIVFTEKNFSNKLYETLKDIFFDKDYIKIAIIELNGIIKKEED